MTQRRVEQSAIARSLVWLLLLSIAFMGLTVARQQALGSLHMHADLGLRDSSTISSAISSLANEWQSRWRQQQVFGHGYLRPYADRDAKPWPTANSGRAGHSAQPHSHDDLERHYHATSDATVLALDGAAGSAEDSANGAMLVLPMLATTSSALVLSALAAREGLWPVDGAVSFVSWSVAPPLRPPSL